VDGGQFAGAVEARELVGIATVRLDALARLARNPGGRDEDAGVAVPLEEAAQRIAAGSRFVAEAERDAGMGGLECFGELEHVVMGAADHPVAAHLGGIRRGQGDGDAVIVDIHPDEQDRALRHGGHRPEDGGGGGSSRGGCIAARRRTSGLRIPRRNVRQGGGGAAWVPAGQSTACAQVCARRWRGF